MPAIRSRSISTAIIRPWRFLRATSNEPGKSDISQEDIDHILAAEGEGKPWSPIQVRSGKPTWVRADGKLIARFSPNKDGKADDAAVLVIIVNTK